MGVDGHKDDQLKSLNLTTNSYNLLGLRLRRFSKKILAYGGGGYGPMSALSMISFLKGLQGEKVSYESKSLTENKNFIDNIEKIILRSKSLSNFFS